MRILAIDYGDARTGFALCDPFASLASKLEVFESRRAEAVVARVCALVAQHKVEEVLLGLPLNMNGSEGPRAEKTRQFAQMLQEALGESPKLVLWDERSTTTSAISMLNDTNTRGKKRKAVLDAVAATVLLQSYLDFRKNKAL